MAKYSTLQSRNFQIPKPIATPPATQEEEINAETLVLGQNELALKLQEADRSRLSNPLVVALIGAIIVGLTNIAVTFVTTRSQRNVAASSDARQIETEKLRAENANITEVIKLNDADKVQAGFCRLLKLNLIQTADTYRKVSSYVAANKGCDEPPAPPKAQWIQAALTMPGCGNSGCYQSYSVCGVVPADMKATGNTRAFIDTFSNAWGEWQGGVNVEADKVCRTFIQHSHNVTRTASFEFEVVPK